MLRILVISDFHSFSKPRSPHSKKPAPSHFTIKTVPGGPDVPGDLFRHLADQKIEADVVACCGDIVDRTDTGALDGAWAFARKVQDAVKAKHLLICTGNHDVDSRGTTGAYSPFETLKLLSPTYPSAAGDDANVYWSNNYFIREDSDARFLVLNTCSAHGYKKSEEFGIFERHTAKVLDVLQKRPRLPINVCVCHHHPHRHGEHDLGDHDDMRNGQTLLDGLSKAEAGQWLIIHGHKHHAKLSYAQGNSFSPVVFSSGSLSARLYEKLQDHARNQYHLITIDTALVKKYRRLVGRYQSWSWFPLIGWRDAGDSEGLPARGGFGFRDVLTLWQDVRLALQPGRNRWADIVDQFEPVAFLIPADLAYFISLLEADGVKIEYDSNVGTRTIASLII